MSLLQMSLAGGVMILVITVIRALAMDHVPKRTFPVLWGIALFRLLIPLSLPSALSIYSLLKRTPAPVTANIPAAAVSAVLAGQAAALPQSVSVSEAALPVGSIIWAVGTALCAVTFAVAYRNCYREFQMSLPVENDASRRWLQAHPLRRTITLRQTDRISSPLTFGLLHPVILMPKETDWDDEASLQFVLEHEFVHIRRLDTAAKLLLITAVCVHWFNPAVWAMYALANRDIELSCDEAVIRRFGHDARASYARVLIRMEEVQSGLTPLCNHFSKNVIEERITAIMKTKKITVISLLLAAVSSLPPRPKRIPPIPHTAQSPAEIRRLSSPVSHRSQVRNTSPPESPCKRTIGTIRKVPLPEYTMTMAASTQMIPLPTAFI